MNEITKLEIKEILAKKYVADCDFREFNITDNGAKNIDEIVYYFTICGSPPKGYAMYVPGRFMIVFFDMELNRFKTLRNIEVTNIKEVK